MAVPKIRTAGSGERAQYLVRDYNDNTIRFVMHYPGAVDPDILHKAAKAVVESVDVLHGTFFADAARAYWRINEDVEESSYYLCVDVDGDPAVTAASLSVLPIYPEDKAQIHVTLVRSSTASSIVVRMSHLVVDGGDGKYLLGKLAEAYNLILETGSAEGLKVKDGSRAPEQVYENMGFHEIRNLLSNPLSGVEKAYPYPTEDAGMARITTKVISGAVMSASRQRAKAAGATANDLLVAAFYHAYAAMDGVDASAPMSVSSMMDLRRHCPGGESQGLCNLSGALPTTLKNGCTGSFEQTLTEIAAQTATIKHDPYAGLEGMPILHSLTRTMPIWLLNLAVGKIYGKLSLGMTNLGNLKCGDYSLGGLAPNGGLFGGPLKKKPGMQISVISFDGECVLTVAGSYTREDAKALQQTLDHMERQIAAYAAGE